MSEVKWSEVKWVKWSEWSEWSEWVNPKGSLYFYETEICYRVCIYFTCYIVTVVQNNSLMGFKIWWSWGSRFFFSKSPIVGRFSIFHAKLQVFAGLGAFLGELFCHFLVIFSCKISVFCGAGRYFWVKKDNFLRWNFTFLGGWVLFLVPFLSTFCHFS